jgi:hypothetical protein
MPDLQKFSWVIIMSAAWQTAALILRILSTRHQLSYGFYVPSQILILLAPICELSPSTASFVQTRPSILGTNAFCYMVLGRMIHFYIPEHTIFGISSRRLTVIFVLLDIV